MKMIKLTRPEGTPLYINVDEIVSITYMKARTDNNNDLITSVQTTCRDFYWEVKEDIPTILAKL